MAEQKAGRGEQRVQALGMQALAVARAADQADEAQAALLSAAVETVFEATRREQRKLTEGPVRQLPANASDQELREARLQRAVRRGDALYLPCWRDMAVGFPNIFVRSAVFAASKPGKPLFEEPIATQGDATLTMTGHQLGHYDRQVFAACLRYYRGDSTLHSAEETTRGWRVVSFWQLAEDLKVPYGLNGHIAIRESLIRLNAAHLRIRVKRKDLPLPRLIEVAFEDGYQGRASTSHHLKGSDKVAFKVLDSMASLFGPEDWSNISDYALFGLSGLQSWLAAYYRTHAKVFPVKLKDLHAYSGVACDLREFRRRLKEALGRLQSEKVDADVRVHSFEMDKETVKVHLVRWLAKKE